MKEMRGRDMGLKGNFFLILGLILLLSGCTVERIHFNESVNVSITDNDYVGHQFNAWNNTLTGVNGRSEIVDTLNRPHISFMTSTSGSTTLKVYVSEDGVNFDWCEGLTTKLNSPSGNTAHIFFTAGARYYQIESSNNVRVNATIIAKP